MGCTTQQARSFVCQIISSRCSNKKPAPQTLSRDSLKRPPLEELQFLVLWCWRQKTAEVCVFLFIGDILQRLEPVKGFLSYLSLSA